VLRYIDAAVITKTIEPAIWTATNAAWCAVDAQSGLLAQAALMAVYTGLAVWGWVAWRRTAPATG